MKLRFFSTVADNVQIYEGGKEYDVVQAVAGRLNVVSEERAQYFIKVGQAEAVAEAPQATALADETERATLPKAQKRGP